MAAIRYIKQNSVSRIFAKDGKIQCGICCGGGLDVQFYPKTSVDGFMSGTICALLFFPTDCWCDTGLYNIPADPITRDHIITDVEAARQDGVWSSSVNFEVNAHWDKLDGSGTGGAAFIDVTYKGTTKTASLGNLTIAEYGTNCSGESTGVTITIYATQLPDGSYFEIV
jgi:hypothetical protein